MQLISQEDSMVNITTIFLNWKQMGNGFSNILEQILKRSPTFWGKLNTAWSRIDVTFINRRFLQKNVL